LSRLTVELNPSRDSSVLSKNIHKTDYSIFTAV
jgi:hypothetical protein